MITCRSSEVLYKLLLGERLVRSRKIESNVARTVRRVQEKPIPSKLVYVDSAGYFFEGPELKRVLAFRFLTFLMLMSGSIKKTHPF